MPADPSRSIAEANTLWGALAAAVFVRRGVEEAVISPGSRSTPLTVGLARHPRLNSRVILDERSAGFFALGLARARRQPVVLVCTSGSAVANYLPAVVEAAESGIPLILLTADRPPELRHRQAGQTIDQVKLFGTAVRWFAEAPVPDSKPRILHAWRDLLGQAIDRSQGACPGPVQINCPFREPLGGAPWPHLEEAIAPLVEELPEAPLREAGSARLPALPRRGWILAGGEVPAHPETYVAAVGELADALGWPILADALNPCRHFADTLRAPVLTAYDPVLRVAEAARDWRPEAILQVGPLPTSKVLRQCLEQWQVPTWILAERGLPLNAVGAPATVLPCGPTSVRPPLDPGPRSHDWWHELAVLDRRARDCLDEALEEVEAAEPAIATTLLRALPPETPVYVASSMPVRDAEWFWEANGERRRIHFNRGANGIDGTLSTALGMVEGEGIPGVLYTGDLALLHDTNGFLAARSAFTGGLTIVCVNNGGGGIFNHLPIAQEADVFEEFFATPQPVEFHSLARAYGIEHHLVQGLGELSSRLAHLPARGVRLLELRTDREADAALRRRLFREVQAVLRGAP
ncbi:MAG: 2-succinyl-5-enolpyruvyl-6-hydroxy-3-cyclohexene-1-carboxylic-acid synthase [Verrucomicrobiota bacterium]